MELKEEQDGNKNDCIQYNGCSDDDSIKYVPRPIFAEIGENGAHWDRKGDDVDQRDQNGVEEHEEEEFSIIEANAWVDPRTL